MDIKHARIREKFDYPRVLIGDKVPVSTDGVECLNESPHGKLNDLPFVSVDLSCP